MSSVGCVGRGGSLHLVYFCADPDRAKRAFDAGVDAVLVDCEGGDKYRRQQGWDTEINCLTPSDVESVRRRNPSGFILCRLNHPGDGLNRDDVEVAVECGANGIVLPMAETVEQVEHALDMINGRATLTIMIETEAGVAAFPQMVGLPYDAVYVGLNDLMISRGGGSIFEPLVDGTVERVCRYSTVPVGVGGVTDPNASVSIGPDRVIKEYQRLGVRFSVLRRSFDKAVEHTPMEVVVEAIRHAYDQASGRRRIDIIKDRRQFEELVVEGI